MRIDLRLIGVDRAAQDIVNGNRTIDGGRLEHGEGGGEIVKSGSSHCNGGSGSGEHTVIFAGDDEAIRIRHRALSPSVFANGGDPGGETHHRGRTGLVFTGVTLRLTCQFRYDSRIRCVVLQILKLDHIRLTIREFRNESQCTTHRLNIVGHRRQQHVGTTFNT